MPKIYILCDMEGISGIRRMEQVKREEGALYVEGCKLMMDDINVAVDACFANGATEVVVADTHGGGGQVRVADMDPRAVYELPACRRMMTGLDESFDGVILLGHHAMAGTLNGFLDHTMNSMMIWEFRCNGRPLGEIGIEAAWAGHYNVPVIAVSGDQATADEARALLGEVQCAVVKYGLGRNRARCLAIPAAHQAIRDAIGRAMKSLDACKPFTPTLPAVTEMTVYRSDMVDDLAPKDGIERLDARTIRKTVHSLLDIFSIVW
ncbi:MAG: M55 family metallopeptidase [Planctomycetes bacterium]|nr:M55 family metallopeptidase [Planctomycetota bacterium]